MTVNEAKQILKTKDALNYMSEILECYFNNKYDLELRNLIIVANTNLIYVYIKKYSTMDCFADLEQESKIALIYALDTYNPYKGYTFSTHAKKYIKSTIYQYFIKNNQISIPPYISSLANKYIKLKDTENITDEEFIKKNNISLETLNKVKNASTILLNMVSLDEDIDTFSTLNKTYSDLAYINYNLTSDMEKDEREKILMNYIKKVINDIKLKGMNKDLIIDIALHYFGFNTEQLSNKELADKYNINVSDISHIIFQIKRSLKSTIHQKDIRNELGIPNDVSNENIIAYLLEGEE